LLRGFVKLAEKVAQQSEGSRQSQVAQQCLVEGQALLGREVISSGTNPPCTSHTPQPPVSANLNAVALEDTRNQGSSKQMTPSNTCEAAQQKQPQQKHLAAVFCDLQADVC
jgi:hypothetical protein